MPVPPPVPPGSTAPTPVEPGADLIRATDAWFIREGVPHLVERFDVAAETVNLRTVFTVMVAAAVSAFPVVAEEDDVAFFAALGLLCVGLLAAADNVWVRHVAVRTSIRLRIMPAAVLPAIAIGVGQRHGVGHVIAAVVLGLLVLGIGAFLETFRLWNVIRWAGRQTVDQLRRVFELFGRALPLLLLFAVTLFVNADVWQTAAVIGARRFWILTGFFVVIGVVFLTLRLPAEVRAQMGPVGPDEARRACTGTPVEGQAGRLDDNVEAVEMTFGQRTNLVLILMFTQILQVTLVALMITAFFFLFGLVAVQQTVIASWIGPELNGRPVEALLSFKVSDQEVVVTRPLVRVSAFLGMLSGFYFTIYVITDKTYREDFFDHVLARVRRIVVVRTVYLARLGRPVPTTGDSP